MKKNLLLLSISFVLLAFKADKVAYQYFTKDGKKVSYEKVLKATEKADVIFFGELHNNPIDHWMQLELTKDIYEQINDQLVLGAEMFEADDQVTLTEYLEGKHSYNTLKAEAKLWPNNETDYQPLVDFAKENNIPFIATNIPRRYANMVYKGGLESLNELSDFAKQFIAPLPIEYDGSLKGYKDMLEMAGGHGGDNLPKAQAVKDATMAYFINKNLKIGATFIHYNGTYHSNNFEGIIWYLNKLNPNLKIVTIASVEQKDVEKLEDDYKGIADFILCTPETMTKTH